MTFVQHIIGPLLGCHAVNNTSLILPVQDKHSRRLPKVHTNERSAERKNVKLPLIQTEYNQANDRTDFDNVIHL